MAQCGHRGHRGCGIAPLVARGVPLFYAIGQGAAFGGHGVNFVLEILLFVERALALVWTMSVRRVGEIFVLVWKVVQEESWRVVRKRDRGN